LYREAFTMAFYVAVVLNAALIALPEDSHVSVIGLIWGTTVGLALAHLFAFRLAAHLVTGFGSKTEGEALIAGAQMAGAVVVAIIATLPVLFANGNAEVVAGQFILDGFIGLAAFAVARANGAGPVRSIVFAGLVVVVALGIALAKNALVGH
jgi:hypothetical protein